MSLIEQARETFLRQYGYEASHSFHAPGRVNLIGEHTDYNDGFVLPAAINFGTVVAASPRTDKQARICAVNFDEQIVQFSLDQPIEKSAAAGWSNYVRAVADTLIRDNHSLNGVDLTIVGDVPYGAGLSSSAALEIVLTRMFADLNQLTISAEQAAQYGQQAENNFIGAQTGIMDQLISGLGQKDQALLIDCRTLATRPVPLDSDYRIVIFNSNVKRGLVDSEYNMRRQQCQQSATILGVPALRDATLPELEAAREKMDDVTYRRARHVITENTRTLLAADALQARDWTTLGELMRESHESMKLDFEITVPPIDGLVELIREVIANRSGGVRMTGGGFGGCVVSLVHRDDVDTVIQHVAEHYESTYGLKESVYICQAVDGAFMA